MIRMMLSDAQWDRIEPLLLGKAATAHLARGLWKIIPQTTASRVRPVNQLHELGAGHRSSQPLQAGGSWTFPS